MGELRLLLGVLMIFAHRVDGLECYAGGDVIDRTAVLSTHQIVAILSDYVIPCDGDLTTWEFWAQQSFAFKAIVLRKVEAGSPTRWSVVGINDIPASSVTIGQKTTYSVPVSDRIKVRSGDVIGIAQYSNHPSIKVDIITTANTPKTSVHVAVIPGTTTHWTDNEIANIQTTSTIYTFTSEALWSSSPLQVSVSAEVESGATSTEAPTTTVGYGGNGASTVFQHSVMMTTFLTCLYWLTTP